MVNVGTDSFTYTLSDGDLTATGTVTIDVAPPSGLVSDDFSAPTLDEAVWAIQGATGATATVSANTTDAFLELITPDGNFDVWQTTRNGAQALQEIEDVDFQIETRFLTTPSVQSQFQGILVEQDDLNWLRFDVVSNGSTLRAFTGITVNGISTPAVQMVIPGGEAPFLRVDRTGDDWTFEYSLDGEVWEIAATINQPLVASGAGVFAGNVGPATGYTAQVDYVEVSGDPIVDEDGSLRQAICCSMTVIPTKPRSRSQSPANPVRARLWIMAMALSPIRQLLAMRAATASPIR